MGKRKKYAYVLVFRGGNLILEADAGGATQPYEEDNLWYDDQDAYERNFYPVQFADGVCAATVYDFSSARMHTLSMVVALCVAALAFLFIMLWNYRRLSQRITKLSHNVCKVVAGNLAHEIMPTGRDEITDLAVNIDSMRTTLLKQLKNEQAAWQANTELLRAISHDIRTPLTTLLGYLNLLQTGQYETQAQLTQYLSLCGAKAQQLRQLTDKLFGYFLVFSNPDLQLKLERYDVELLFTQLLGEEILCLENEGFQVQWERLSQGYCVQTDVIQLQRVTGNLFSNIRKYADMAQPVWVSECIHDGCVCVQLKNAVNPSAGCVESNRIGLRTATKLMELLGGQLQILEQAYSFFVELRLPL